MKRKIQALTLMLLSLVAGGVSTYAQNVGEWRLYSLFADGVDKIIEAKNKVYYLSSNRVHSYDKNYNESYSYTTENVLNDINVADIYYNAEKNYVLVAYDSSNMDIIDDNDDSVINLSDIDIANLTYSKTINDVAFGNGKIVIGTAFGLVVYDDESKAVTESGIYGKNVKNVTVSGDKILASIDGSYYFATIGSRINTFDKLTRLSSAGSTMIQGTDNGFFELNSGTKAIRYVKVDWNSKSCSNTDYRDITNVKSVVRKSDNSGAFITNKQIAYVDFGSGEVDATRVTLPENLQGQVISYNKDLSTVWAGDEDGIGCFDLTSGDASVSKFKPEALTCAQVAFIEPSNDGSHIYVSNLGYTTYRSVGNVYNDPLSFATRQRTDVLVNQVPRDASLLVASASSSVAQNSQRNDGSTAVHGIDKLAVDPQDSERYFIPTITDGVYVVKNNEEVGKLNADNMPIRNWYSSTKGWITSCYFDPAGNLWVGYRPGWYDDDSKPYSPYLILPADKVQGDLSAVTASDWIQSKHKGIRLAGNGETRMLMCKKSSVIFTFDGEWQCPLGVYHTNGTYADTSDDVFVELTVGNTTDDGTTFTPGHYTIGVEDKNGQAWFGTTSGVAVVPKPSSVTDASYGVTRPKVPRNDGTNYADYLLDAEQVNAIAVDETNRKWIGTENSGLYYVSENGDEILANYTTENSPLPSNNIQSLYCDPNSNLVYIGLDKGLVTYSSTTVAASADYSDVYAYPNPVRPDYTGWITVTGLMENSLVKISDAAGNVVFQTRSSGGMAVWDGCNAGGDRVSTGIYFVYASQNENDNASAVVTKIMVVK